MLSASREVVLAFVTDHMQARLATRADHRIDIPVAAALAYAAVHEAIHLCFRADDPVNGERVLRETIRFIRCACEVPAA